MSYVIGVDGGTESLRAFVFDLEGRQRGRAFWSLPWTIMLANLGDVLVACVVGSFFGSRRPPMVLWFVR